MEKTKIVYCKDSNRKAEYKNTEFTFLGYTFWARRSRPRGGGCTYCFNQILRLGGILPVWAILAIVLVATMLMSDIINNAATVVLMAPIGISPTP